jgi:hypothetical protein
VFAGVPIARDSLLAEAGFDLVREKILEASASLMTGAWDEKNCPSISKMGRGECVEVDLPS